MTGNYKNLILYLYIRKYLYCINGPELFHADEVVSSRKVNILTSFLQQAELPESINNAFETANTKGINNTVGQINYLHIANKIFNFVQGKL